MSEQNVEVVQRLFDAVARRDSATVLALYDPEVEWDGSRHRWGEVMRRESVFRGHEELREWSRAYHEMWEHLEDTVEELIDAGVSVVSIVTTRGRGKTSQVDVEWKENSGVWTVRAGRITKVVWFPTRREALEAAGLSE